MHPTTRRSERIYVCMAITLRLQPGTAQVTQGASTVDLSGLGARFEPTPGSCRAKRSKWSPSERRAPSFRAVWSGWVQPEALTPDKLGLSSCSPSRRQFETFPLAQPLEPRPTPCRRCHGRNGSKPRARLDAEVPTSPDKCDKRDGIEPETSPERAGYPRGQAYGNREHRATD